MTKISNVNAFPTHLGLSLRFQGASKMELYDQNGHACPLKVEEALIMRGVLGRKGKDYPLNAVIEDLKIRRDNRRSMHVPGITTVYGIMGAINKKLSTVGFGYNLHINQKSMALQLIEDDTEQGKVSVVRDGGGLILDQAACVLYEGNRSAILTPAPAAYIKVLMQNYCTAAVAAAGTPPEDLLSYEEFNFQQTICLLTNLMRKAAFESKVHRYPNEPSQKTKGYYLVVPESLVTAEGRPTAEAAKTDVITLYWTPTLGKTTFNRSTGFIAHQRPGLAFKTEYPLTPLSVSILNHLIKSQAKGPVTPQEFLKSFPAELPRSVGQAVTSLTTLLSNIKSPLEIVEGNRIGLNINGNFCAPCILPDIKPDKSQESNKPANGTPARPSRALV